MVDSRELVALPDGADTSDLELVGQAQAGRREASETLARRHRQAAYLLALQMLGNRDDAMDVTQEAMLRFFTSLGSFDRERRVQPWLFAIVRNQVRDLWRRRQRRPGEGLGEAGEALTRQLADPTANPEADLRRRELKQRVWRALAKLPAEKREIIVLRDFHDLSYSDIAQVLDIPIGTVMSRLHGARRQLRAQLEEGGRHA
ncbi:MAG: sigma-70 family RNA polymerase sigma factor [Vicinamibacterales bacterium]|jgi:RNA polymerase sigma-70 factor (ECF subfamily)|nr:sigma-70 family RNA polymerase sigma factor [Vicinamibacterales bacterium]|tara:strand:- start:2639 stop:3244 length:606 start_codon:yes stop_codon:yes gene_type:complete